MPELKLTPTPKAHSPFDSLWKPQVCQSFYHWGEGDLLGQWAWHKRPVFLEQDNLRPKIFILSHWRTNSYSSLGEIHSGTTYRFPSYSRLRKTGLKTILYRSLLFLSRGLSFLIHHLINSLLELSFLLSLSIWKSIKQFKKIKTLHLSILWKQIITKEGSKLYKSLKCEIKNILTSIKSFHTLC